MRNISRREVLKLGAATAVAELAALGIHGCGGGSVMTPPVVSSACSKLTDIEHVVILIQENRSFDHYFGSYRGVRGYSDQHGIPPARFSEYNKCACWRAAAIPLGYHHNERSMHARH